MTVRFIHDNYKTIRKDVTLTIVPASAEAYNGNELIVEDTEYTVEDLQRLFGAKVASLVDGLTKIKSAMDNKHNSQKKFGDKILLENILDHIQFHILMENPIQLS